MLLFYSGLLDWRDVISWIRFQSVKYNVTDNEGNDSRIFKDISRTENNEVLASSNNEQVSKSWSSHTGNNNLSGSKLKDLTYRGMDDDIDDRPRASSELSKKDLSIIRSNSALAPKLFARETSVTSQTGFKTHSSYSRGFSSANSGSGERS